MQLRPALTLTLAMLATTSALAAAAEYFVYFGTYTNAKSTSKGIYRSRFDVTTGRLTSAELAAEAKDPAWLAVHPNGKFLYAIDESADSQRNPGVGVSAYELNPATGALTLLNRQSHGSTGACHLSVDSTGRTVLVANYGGGGVSAISLQPDGRLGALGSVIQHTGSSVNPARQKSPHAHQIVVSPDNRFALVPDLGLDRILVYAVGPAAAKLTAHDPASASVAPGSGPRHLAFHPTGRFAYVINEMLCTMTAFSYDAARATLTSLQTISTLPPGESVQPGTSTAEVLAHPNGKFLYGSNRGHHTIVAYAIDATSGQLTLIGHQSTLGKTPRHFALDPTGRWLLAENQDSHTVAVFGIDEQTGRLTPAGPLLSVPSPVSAVFVPVR